ncbi:hypothetical protein EDC18_11343 [Natranaerovirga pectinivora]|uniref:Uncharacterized protein n=1 Tax=Natranaerovirga pectinivora TaxID=682400 RepID=A0A4R3MGG9_9FIRM|nr:hypothetical protein [Natranaerovirga pectinivora]TCT12197.1 hypothetical protein EDC18_11343 [Natranaerovirga pectinivora]
MNSKCISIKRIIIINIIAILFSAIFAIIVHALLPSSLDDIQFDSILVELFGFPFVASLYFIVLFTHCAIAVRYIGVRSEATKFQIGIRFGVVFAMIYLLGMQEVVVEATAFSEWGLGFVKHNFIMGIGDAIPAISLCFVISFFTIANKEKSNLIHKLNFSDIIKAVSIIAFAIVVGRTFAYESGIITSNYDTYPIPTYVWTVLFGLMLGFIYVILYPLLAYKNNLNYIPLRLAIVVGLNWIIFNCFIGLIFKDTMFEMLLRSGLDVLIFFIASIIIGKYIIAKEFISKDRFYG